MCAHSEMSNHLIQNHGFFKKGVERGPVHGTVSSPGMQDSFNFFLYIFSIAVADTVDFWCCDGCPKLSTSKSNGVAGQGRNTIKTNGAATGMEKMKDVTRFLQVEWLSVGPNVQSVNSP